MPFDCLKMLYVYFRLSENFDNFDFLEKFQNLMLFLIESDNQEN